MGIDMIIGLVVGALLIFAGYIVRTKKVFFFLAGYTSMWEPVNKERLGSRIGNLLIIIGVIAILASFFTIWFGSIVGTISGILALVDVIMIIMAVGLDQMGH